MVNNGAFRQVKRRKARVEVSTEELEGRLEQAERALERCERTSLASRYAGAVMHEVNNPLEAITNLIYLTKLQKDDPNQVVENMTIIEDQLRTLGRVTQQALSFHREQTAAKDQDLVEIAEAALKLHHDKLTRHGITVVRKFRGSAIARVHGSEILQVVSNLIINAVDALPMGTGRIFVSAKACHACMQITVTDDGPGIPRPFASHLFEPYLTSKDSGTGLGLWLSKRIIEKHRGSLRFRTSQSGARRGTTFRIHLPVTTAAAVA
jgi:signal transduction histidine kinase